MNIRKNKGVTLIVLVITVILLIIIAGIAISMILSEDNLIEKARWSEYLTEFTTVEERYRLYINEKYVEEFPEQVTYENYPIGNQIDISTMPNTLRSTIMQLENLEEYELSEIDKVNLYEINIDSINIKTKRAYAINMASGKIYSIDSMKYLSKIYHTPWVYSIERDSKDNDGTVIFSKINQPGTYTMIVDAKKLTEWKEVDIYYDEYVEGSLTYKLYTSDDECEWTQIEDLNDIIETNSEKVEIVNCNNTRFIKVVVKLDLVNGECSALDYALIKFYRYVEVEDIEPDIEENENVQNIDGMYIATQDTTFVQHIEVTSDNSIIYFNTEGTPDVTITVKSPNGTTSTILYSQLNNTTIPIGSTVTVSTSLKPGDSVSPIEVLERKPILVTSRLEEAQKVKIDEWKTVKRVKFAYCNTGEGIWDKCYVNNINVDDTGIITFPDRENNRIKVTYQKLNEQRWSSNFTNIKDAGNAPYLKVTVEYQTFGTAQYNNLNSTTVKVSLFDDVNPEIEVTNLTTSVEEGKNITFNYRITDNLELNLDACKYIVTLSNEKYDIENTIWNSATKFTSTTGNISIKPSKTGANYLHILAVDNEENYCSYVSPTIWALSNSALIPKLTSNTSSDLVTISVSDNYSSYPAWMAFDDNKTTCWATASGNYNAHWLKIAFKEPKVVKKYTYYCSKTWGTEYKFYLQGSNNDKTWVTLEKQAHNGGTSGINVYEYQTLTFDVDNITPYKFYRIYYTQGGWSWGSTGGGAVYSLQLYGY